MNTHPGWGPLAAVAIIMNILALIALWAYKEWVEGFFLLLLALVVINEQFLRHGRIMHEVETPLAGRLPLPQPSSPLAYYESQEQSL